MLISDAEIDLEFLSREYEGTQFRFYRSTPENYINCFVCRVEDEAQLSQVWSGVASLIAAEFQTKLKTKFEMWNIYLLFVVNQSISKAVEYEIENDRFSMRKLVVSPASVTFDILRYLNDEVLGADLDLQKNFRYSPSQVFEKISSLHQEITDISSGWLLDDEGFSLDDITRLTNWVAQNEI